MQFFNVGNYGCEAGTEDGYSPLSDDRACPSHDSDYQPQDWRVALSELLRSIQFFNSEGQGYFPQGDTEDGFAAGALAN